MSRFMLSRPVNLDLPRRAPIACNYCRKRKTKCLGGNGRLACRACSVAGRTCTYPDAQKTVRVPEAYLVQLETRLKEYEKGHNNGAGRQESLDVVPLEYQHQHDPPATTLSGNSEPLTTTNEDDIDGNPLTEKIAHLVLSPEGDKRYIGNSSSASLGKKFLDFVRSFKTGLDIGEDFITPAYNSCSNFSIRANAHQAKPFTTSLPPFPFAKRLYAAQYSYIGTIFSFTSPETFEKNIREMYDREVDFTNKRDCLRYCQIFIILAFGQMYSINQWTSYDGPPGFEYFQQAMSLLPAIHEQPSVTFVEVLSLVGYFFQNLNRRDAASLYIELALRMAILLGLHQEVSDDTLDDHAREHRRRLWWSVYSLDRILCVKSGNSLTIADEDIGVFPPSRLSDEPDLGPAAVLFHYTELSRILGRIMKNVYRTPRTTAYNLVSSVQSILAELTQWQSNLPHALQCDFTKLDSGISRQCVSMFLHYSQCINMTVRPLVFNVVRICLQNHEKTGEWPDWKEGLQQSTVLAVETCIAAARNSAAVMAAAAKQNLIATYGYMDGEHAFSAAIILVMINIAFPYNLRDRAAMVLALDVLNGMAEKGNLHIRSLHRLLLGLYHTVIPSPTESGNKPASAAPEHEHMSPQPAELAPPETSPTEHRPEPQPIQLPHESVDDPLAAFLAAQQSASPIPMSGDSAFIVPEELLSFENPMGDAILWEEGYGTFDVGMDFDWAQWNS
ncbi:C6 transcription factor [Histoplasma ohiense]|nr:C6 transcription factor [Histoplasma ohiense (nom. inval.)]